MEYSEEIPCSECHGKKEREIDPFPHLVFISCEPISSRDGWCLFRWKDNS